MRAIVVGGGIGGLATALSLRHAGIEARVFEQASELREIGAGLQLAPNATRILNRLGLGDALAAESVRPTAIELRRWNDGRVLLRQALGKECERAYGAPYLHVARPDLLKVLVRAVPAGQLVLNRRCVAIAEADGEVTATFHDGSVARGDVLIGADGIHSTVRAALFGDTPARFSGYLAYRGLVPADRIAHLGIPVDLNNFLGPRRHFVRYYVRRGRCVNFVAVVPARDGSVESWSARGEAREAVAEFEGWHPDVREIIGAADEVFRWALCDRPPLETWSIGRTTLLGDAAHAMLPFLAQGACQAIEDAIVLAQCLASADRQDVPEALHRYEKLRMRRVEQVQARSRENAVVYHLPDGDAQRERDARYAAAGPAPRSWLYDHDAGAA